MAVETELDGPPPPIELPCPICKKPKLTHYYWWALSERWIHAPPFHDACLDRHRARARQEPDAKLEIPPKFREKFESVHFKNQKALDRAAGFCMDGPKRVFAVIGVAGRGKSRLCWHVIQGFFAEYKARTGSSPALELFEWSDLMTNPDPYEMQRMKHAKFAYVADIGSTEAFGRARALMQANIRYRIQRNAWTWLCIDDLKFDEDLGRVLKNEAFAIFLDT